MRQTVAILASILGGMAVAGCGGGGTTTPDTGAPFDIKTAFPANDGITGWSQDTVKDSVTGPAVFDTRQKVDATDIDGDVVPFDDVGFKQLAREHYKKDNYSLDLRVWEMNDAAKGKKIYEDILLVDRYSIITWTDEAMGEKGRWGNSGTMWRVNAYKGAYFVEALISPSEQPDTAGKDEAVKFVKFSIAAIK